MEAGVLRLTQPPAARPATTKSTIRADHPTIPLTLQLSSSEKLDQQRRAYGDGRWQAADSARICV